MYSKEFRGFEFGKIYLQNCVLLGKRLLRFRKESFTLKHQVIMNIYGTHPNGWDANILIRWLNQCLFKAIV